MDRCLKNNSFICELIFFDLIGKMLSIVLNFIRSLVYRAREAITAISRKNRQLSLQLITTKPYDAKVIKTYVRVDNFAILRLTLSSSCPVLDQNFNPLNHLSARNGFHKKCASVISKGFEEPRIII